MSEKHKDGPLGAGDKLGGFRVVKLLGKGGMGFVYLVEAPETGLKYAAKIMLPPDSEEGVEWRGRFSREAEFAMKIRHRNLIRVHDAGEDPHTHLCYIIMEHVPGGTLSDRLKSTGKFDVSDAVSIAAQVASALEVAHRAGVIHRDIKPGNILFDADGVPKIADLGIAKFSNSEETATLTKTGAIIGTPAYMSPEQMIDSHHVDARTDIYSLGMVLYEMLTGTRPNADSTIVELLAKAVNGKELPDIREMRPEVSAAVAYVLSRLVAPRPENRPNSALEAANLLREAEEGNISVPKEYGCSKTLRLRRRKRLQVVCFAAAGFVAGALLIGLGLFAGDYVKGGFVWRGMEENRAKERSRMDYLKKARTYIGETRNSAEAFAKQFAALFADATNDCERAANELGGLLSEICPEDVIAKLKPGAAEEIEAVSVGGTSAEYVVEIVNDMRSLWQTAYGVDSIVRRVDNRISELLSDIDAALKIRGEDEATLERLSVMANGFRERYNDISGSRDVGDAMKSHGIIRSRSSSIVKYATKRILREKELSRRNLPKEE